MIQKIKNLNPFLLLLALLVVGLIVYGAYKIYYDKDTQFITVTGTAQAQFSNQVSSYSITVESHDKEKSKAVESVTNKSSEVVNAVKSFGLDPKDIKTQNLNVYQREEPYLEEGLTKYRPEDWYASYTIDIILRDLTKSEELTSVLVAVESTSMWGPNLTIDDSDTDYGDLLSRAVENAREKAEKIAISSGKKVGKVLSIVEGGSNYNEIYPLRQDAKGLGGGGFDIEPGSSVVSKTVTVTFELK